MTAPEDFADGRGAVARAAAGSVLGVRLDAEIPQATLPVAHGTRMPSRSPRTVEGALICIRRGRREAWDMADVLDAARWMSIRGSDQAVQSSALLDADRRAAPAPARPACSSDRQ